MTDRAAHPGATPGSLYAVLGVAFDASDVQIKSAYHRQARLLHPDAVGDSPQRTAQMADLNEAYATLVDPGRRADYDRGLATAARDPQREWRDNDMMPWSEPLGTSDEDAVAGSSPLSAVIAVAAALGGIFLGLGFAFLAPGLALFGAMLLALAGFLSAVRFRQAVKQGRDVQR